MHFLWQLHKLSDPVRGHRAVQEGRNDRNNITERGRQFASLLEKQSHGPVCNIIAPQPEQAVPECKELHKRPHNRHQDIGLDTEQIIFQADVAEPALPPAHLLAVMGRDAK